MNGDIHHYSKVKILGGSGVETLQPAALSPVSMVSGTVHKNNNYWQ
jgi:hypothetical protein